MSNRVLLSFDVEEFDIPLEYNHSIGHDEQMQVGGDGFAKVLDLLDRCDVNATLFTTAAFAERWPDIVRRAAQKHEIASHGYYHSRFEETDLAKSKEVLEAISSRKVRGFRRARFGKTSAKAIIEAGYEYDSSENPIYLPGRYNHFFSPRTLYRKEEGFWEIPISASPMLRIPLFWLAFKNYPMPLFKSVAQWTLRHDGYLNIFFHPWEFCNLAGYGLPSYVTRIDGDALLRRLEIFLTFLKTRADFLPMGEFLETKSS